MNSLIRDRAASTPQMLAVFSDRALVAGALAFEAALARAQAAEGLIGPEAAALIAEACAAPLDVAVLAEAAAHAGALAIPLVAELRARLGSVDPGAAAAVHRGATSQDVADTALMLQAKAGVELIDRDLTRIAASLEAIARAHAATPMLARTLLQSAAPTTLGLKAAQWRAAVLDASGRLRHESKTAVALQMGGPVGTLAGLRGKGQAIARRMAEELGLTAPVAPWHARRGAIAGLGAALAIATGSVGKIARDLTLLAQGEVGEAFEPRIAGRGGSSAMAHKRNPTGCQVALSAALRAPHLAATLMSGLCDEHERGLGGWQAQAPVLAELFNVSHGAIAAMADTLEGLEIDTAAMTRNLAAAAVGEDVGEAPGLICRLLEGDG